jgi:hypothetical protein
VATEQWYVNATTNSSGVFTKVWVTQGQTSNTISGPWGSEAAAKKGAEQTLGTQSLTGWRGTAAVLGAAVTGAGNSILGGGITPGAISAGESAGQSTFTGLAAVGDFFQRLTQASTWERVGEVVLGLLLIAVGVAHMTHAVPIATKLAGAVALA